MEMCWSESPSSRPIAQELLRCLQDTSRAWVSPSPLRYPVSDNDDGGTGPGLSSGNERNRVAGAVACSLFVLVVGMLCALLLPPT